MSEKKSTDFNSLQPLDAFNMATKRHLEHTMKKNQKVNEKVDKELLKIVRKTAREEAKRVAEALIERSLAKKAPSIGFAIDPSYEDGEIPYPYDPKTTNGEKTH